MEKVDVTFQELLKILPTIMEGNFLLTSVSGQGNPNIMTVGHLGISARPYPFVCEYIRPSCRTAKLIEETGDYVLNVPQDGMEDIVEFCGTVSGHDHDKFNEKNLTAIPSREVKSPIIGECKIHLECRLVGIFEPRPGSISGAGLAYYETNNIPVENYHRIYMAEIVAIYADTGAVEIK